MQFDSLRREGDAASVADAMGMPLACAVVSRIKEKEKSFLLDVPVSPSGLFDTDNLPMPA